MYLLQRTTAGFTSNLAVFNNEEQAKRFELDCKRCHGAGIYTYAITRVAFNPLKYS